MNTLFVPFNHFQVAFTQTNVLAWEVADKIVNFPHAKITYEVNVEIFDNLMPMIGNRKIILRLETNSVDLSQHLSGLQPFTKFRVSLRSKTKWATSSDIASTYFHTSGKPASKPRNFRVFWSPIEKVIKHIIDKWCNYFNR